MIKLKRKKLFFFSTISLLIVLLSLTSCQESELNSNQVIRKINKKATKEIRFIGQWLNEGKREKLLRDFVREYEFKNQEITVNLKFPEEVYLGTENAMNNQSFVAKIINEDEPEWDIIRLNNQFDEVVAITGDSAWAKNNLVDFSQYPEFRENTMPSLLSDEMKAKWGGIIPGPYIEGQYWALWSNNEVAKKIGVEIKQYNMTTTDLMEYIKAVDNYNKNNPGDSIIAIHDGNDWGTLFVMVFHMYLSELNNIDLLYSVENNEKKLAAWRNILLLLEQLSKNNPTKNIPGGISWYQCGMDLLNEKALFYINGSWMYNIFEKADSAKTLNCVPNEFPVVNNTTTYPGSYLAMWGVLKNSPNRDAAVNLLLAMNKPDIGDMWVQKTKSPTGIRTTLSGASISSDQFEQFAHHIQEKYGNKLYHYSEQMNKYILGPSFWLSNYFKDVIDGNLSASEAMDRINNDLGNH